MVKWVKKIRAQQIMGTFEQLVDKDKQTRF